MKVSELKAHLEGLQDDDIIQVRVPTDHPNGAVHLRVLKHTFLREDDQSAYGLDLITEPIRLTYHYQRGPGGQGTGVFP